MLTQLIQSDGVMDRFEWVFVTVVQKHIAPLKIERANKTIAASGVSVSVGLGMLAYYGATVKEAAQDAFISGAKTCGLENSTIPKLSDCSIEALRNALRRLQTMRYVDRKQFLLGCEKVVVHDGFVTATEAEVIRAIGDVLGCPIPLFN